MDGLDRVHLLTPFEGQGGRGRCGGEVGGLGLRDVRRREGGRGREGGKRGMEEGGRGRG
jgi:hypothetical protein